jgi:hypothetical protein
MRPRGAIAGEIYGTSFGIAGLRGPFLPLQLIVLIIKGAQTTMGSIVIYRSRLELYGTG